MNSTTRTSIYGFVPNFPPKMNTVVCTTRTVSSDIDTDGGHNRRKMNWIEPKSSLSVASYSTTRSCLAWMSGNKHYLLIV